MHLQDIYIRGINPYNPINMNNTREMNYLRLFDYFIAKLNEEIDEETGYTSPLQNWSDTYGMTFLMRLLAESAENQRSHAPIMDLMIEGIIQGHYFDEEYINTKAEVELGPQFDQQHILGIASENKKTNTVISKNQLIPTKRIEKQNPETGEYEPFAMEGQIKVVSKNKVQVCENGEERETRVMITTQKPGEKLDIPSEKYQVRNEDELDFEGYEELLAPIDSVSYDGYESEEENHKEGIILDVEEDVLQTKIERWTATAEPQHQDEIKPKLLRPEHFDKTSVLTKGNQTFMTKENKYRYAQSASTRYIETHSIIETPNKYYAKKTTLLLLSCRTGKWKIVESLLNEYPNSLDINHKDAKGWNALHLAIEANKADICKKMISSIDTYGLKTEVNIDGKNALKLVTENINKGAYFYHFKEVEAQILEKTGQKTNPHRNQQQVVDKSQTQMLRLCRGFSCGFIFECLELPYWTCLGDNCSVRVSLGEDYALDDNDKHHYHKYELVKIINSIAM